ncbi:MAG: hypothetical protein LBG74_02035 [Spirochaetaceae bacterium]|jgi:hypothetical protein|nr:hypothetical protein [Spirochaetaceae bacterium]
MKKMLVFAAVFCCACQFDLGNEGVHVPEELLGTWGLTTTEKAKYDTEIVRISPARVEICGLYFDIKKVEYTNFNRGAYSQTGSIYTRGPGKPALFSNYRITSDGSLYLDGGEILSGGVYSKLKLLKRYDD